MNWSLVWDMVSQYAILIAGKIIAALVILVIGFKLANFLVKFIANRSAFTKLEPGVQSFLKSFPWGARAFHLPIAPISALC